MRNSEHYHKEDITNALASSDQKQTQAMFTHIANCVECSHLFADCMEETQLIKAPKDMKQNILRKANEMAVSNTMSRDRGIVFTREKKNRQMFFYSIKVALAACAALFVIGNVKLQERSSFLYTEHSLFETQHQKKSNSVASTVNDALLDFSNQILNHLK